MVLQIPRAGNISRRVVETLPQRDKANPGGGTQGWLFPLAAHPDSIVYRQEVNRLSADLLRHQTKDGDVVPRQRFSSADFPALVQADRCPLEMTWINTYTTRRGKRLDGSGVEGLVIDNDFNPDHVDLYGRLRTPNRPPAKDDHGNMVASVWNGRLGGVAPGTMLHGYFSKRDEISELYDWNRRLRRELSRKINGLSHVKVVCICVAPDPNLLQGPRKLEFLRVLQKWRRTNRQCYENGIVVIMAAGNHYMTEPIAATRYGQFNPTACYPTILRIGAAVPREPHVEKEWRAARFSAWGADLGGQGRRAFEVDLCAPATRLAALAEGYGMFQGTSCAAPFVAGLVSILFQINPALSVREIHGLLRSTSKPIFPFIARQSGAGMIDPRQLVYRALEMGSRDEAERFRKYMDRVRLMAPEPSVPG